jgi:putative spermidine/putrescine transport system permease protein
VLIAFTSVVLVFIHLPLLVVLVNSFNTSRVFGWPPSGVTTMWWHRAIANDGVRTALATSLKAASVATTLALLLGTLTAFAVARYKFFGRSVISLVVALPIALPGIVTGMALNAAFSTTLKPLGISFGLFTVILGHTTFCVVVVFNNVLARLQRVGVSLQEASADLGARPWTTARLVTFPLLRSALVAGAVLAFGLSFDEIVVTTFTSGPGLQTLPQWVFNNLFRPNQGPIVNAVAAGLLLVSIAPVWVATKLSADPASASGRL